MELESCAPATDPAVTVKKQNKIKRVNLSSNKHGNTEGLMSKSDKQVDSLSLTGYKKWTGQFLRALDVYGIDNFVAF